jgi:hypothetical protein
MLKDEIKKKRPKNKRLGLTCQSYNLSHMTEITQYKTNQNKL